MRIGSGCDGGSEGTVSRTACIIAALLGLAFVWAQNEVPQHELLGCAVADPLPEPPATAGQGGFGFEYQSFRGATEDGRVCTVYRLRNAPERPPTPFRWMLGDEPVVEKARLGRCTSQSECPWMSFVKYFAGAIDTNLSTLSYGLNADAFHEQATTYLSHASIDGSEAAEASEVAASSVGIEVQGVFTTAADVPVEVHLLVKSRFEPHPEGGSVLVYEVEDLLGSGAVTGAGPVRITWDALEIDPVKRVLSYGPSTSAAAAAAETDSVSISADALSVRVRADRFLRDDSFAFHVYASDDPEPLVTVPMAAYVPVDAAR